ncbi:VOC family protein [Clostridiaceae bacterium M8S5]|nr:VOC family protein [Clostridiaceae bacterium M8S5]
MKTKLTHVRANVSDLQRAIEWYENILGFENNGVDINEKWQYVDFKCDSGAVFALSVSDKIPSRGRFNFDIDDIDALWKQLKDKVNIIEPLQTMPYGTRKFTISDPDGNELGFVQQNFESKKK